MVPNVASSNLVARPMKLNPTKTVGFNFIMTCVQILEMADRQFDPQARGERECAGLPKQTSQGREATAEQSGRHTSLKPCFIRLGGWFNLPVS